MVGAAAACAVLSAGVAFATVRLTERDDPAVSYVSTGGGTGTNGSATTTDLYAYMNDVVLRASISEVLPQICAP